MPWAGAYNRVRPDATAFVNEKSGSSSCTPFTIEAGALAGLRRATHAQLGQSWRSVHPFGSGRVFENFGDPDLEERPTAYYGPNLARLRRVKERYDPENVFRSEQSLGSLR